ncbi:MAG: ankyrin repeat domain-containing protein [Pigmentiphaga sp.]|uniref:ankyrin repeat domain-containing protein n=1 Tax=Pigmentiphaga sp. TaxID=1977564 RepID=UPI0029A85951|nr:ankyrin repeat domain-containing protein [Pigmentiphaga sp.]MDX3905431.1 ankyrin repeat domain-containing protein [Pigmentiphaga sp.]
MRTLVRSGWQLLALWWCALAVSTAHAGATEDFWIAIRNDRASAVKSMLARDMEPNMTNELSNTPLLEAIKEESWGVYDALLADKRTDINRKNRLQESPLMYLAILGQTERMEALIARGAEVNQPGWTALHYAASRGHDEAVRLLLEHHAYIDAESPGKMTPLMMAVRYNHASTVKLLLDEGADGYVRNAEGKNAADVGREAGNTQLADDLVERLNHDRQRRLGR